MKLPSLILLLIYFLNLLKNGEFVKSGGNEDGDKNKDDKGKKIVEYKISVKGKGISKHSQSQQNHNHLVECERLNLGPSNEHRQYGQMPSPHPPKPPQMKPSRIHSNHHSLRKFISHRSIARQLSRLEPQPPIAAGSQQHSQVAIGQSTPNSSSSIGGQSSVAYPQRPSELQLLKKLKENQIVPPGSRMYVKAFYQHQESLKRVYEWMQNHILVENDDVRNYMAIMYRMRQNTQKQLAKHYNLIIDESKIDMELENYCIRLGYPFKEDEAIDKILYEVEQAILQQIQHHLPPPLPTDQPDQQIVDGQFGPSSHLINQEDNHGDYQNIVNNEEMLRIMAALNAQQLGESSSHQMESMPPNQILHYNVNNQSAAAGSKYPSQAAIGQPNPKMYVEAFYHHQNNLNRIYKLIQHNILLENDDDVRYYMAILYRMRKNTEEALANYNLIIDESKIDKELENYCMHIGYPFKEIDESILDLKDNLAKKIYEKIPPQFRAPPFPTDQSAQGQFGTSSQLIQQTGNHRNISNNEGMLRNMAALSAQKLGESSSHQMEEMAQNQFPFFDEGNHPIAQFQTQLQRSTLSDQTNQNFDYMQFLNTDDDQIQHREENAQNQVNIPAEINEANGNETSNRSGRMRGRITAGNNEQQIGDGQGYGQEAEQQPQKGSAGG